MPESLAIIVLTHNEAENLPRCLKSIAEFGEIIVVDSGSNDGTQEIANNSAIQNAGDSIAGFYCCWKTMLDQRWLRRSDSFPKWQLRIVRRGRANFIDSGHGQKEGSVEGELGYVREPYLHYALSKGWEAWWAKHNQYSDEEAADRLSRSASLGELFSKDPSRRNRALKPILSRIPGWPLLRFLHMYILKGGFLEGREGFAYCASMGWYEYLIRAKMRDLRTNQ
ncbi:MAG: glycosyl transferase family 2 [Verrucomicrobia bacterium]|nr:MAG: glycosyl transferase family 2 [Verrucomicrobiota bacterium]